MSDDVLYKAGISNIKYIWHASDGSCDTCQSLDGTEYDFAEDIPDKPHPNCNCYIEEACENDDDEEMCDCYELFDQIDEMVGDAQSLQEEAEVETSEINSILSEYADLTSRDSINALRDLEGLLHPLETFCHTLAGFIEGWLQTKELEGNVPEADKYYHAKANCQAAQLGITGSAIAEGLANLKEFLDFFHYTVGERKTIQETLEMSAKDQEANEAGREAGRENPTEEPEDILRDWIPENLPEIFW